MMRLEASRSAFGSCNDRFMKNYKQDIPFEKQMEILRDMDYVKMIPVTYDPNVDPIERRDFMAQYGISPGTVFTSPLPENGFLGWTVQESTEAGVAFVFTAIWEKEARVSEEKWWNDYLRRHNYEQNRRMVVTNR